MLLTERQAAASWPQMHSTGVPLVLHWTLDLNDSSTAAYSDNDKHQHNRFRLVSVAPSRRRVHDKSKQSGAHRNALCEPPLLVLKCAPVAVGAA